jgi:tRNA pseudouridine55 synthase
MDGFIVVDKPAGMTSHDVVSVVRRVTGRRKAGHTGTLDPFATGVLPVALGEGTKAIPYLDESVKEYRGVMRLGIETDTQDCTGRVTREREWQGISPAEVREVTLLFLGRLFQVPPMYSALKRDGVPLYRLARSGREVEREARQIEIHDFTVESISLPDVAFRVRCSRGTYVRTLAADMGERLGCGAHLVELRRTASGPFTGDQALSLDRLTLMAGKGELAAAVISTNDALSHLREVCLTQAGVAKTMRGIVPEPADFLFPLASPLGAGERVRLSRGETLVAVAEATCGEGLAAAATMRLLRVFNELSPLHDGEVVVHSLNTVSPK